jgi:hypothetical protein
MAQGVGAVGGHLDILDGGLKTFVILSERHLPMGSLFPSPQILPNSDRKYFFAGRLYRTVRLGDGRYGEWQRFQNQIPAENRSTIIIAISQSWFSQTMTTVCKRGNDTGACRPDHRELASTGDELQLM